MTREEEIHCYKSRVQVRLGEHHIAVDEGTEQWISSSRVIRHPNYSSYNTNNDIMLIKLSKPANQPVGAEEGGISQGLPPPPGGCPRCCQSWPTSASTPSARTPPTPGTPARSPPRHPWPAPTRP